MADGDDEALVRELLNDPAKFEASGRSYGLLNALLSSGELKLLESLLRKEDLSVLRMASWIAVELGSAADELHHVVVPLLHCIDREVRYHALEFVYGFSSRKSMGHFNLICERLRDVDEVVKRRSVELLAAASQRQIISAIRFFQNSSSAFSIAHVAGLKFLESGARKFIPELHAGDKNLAKCYFIAKGLQLQNLLNLVQFELKKTPDLEFAPLISRLQGVSLRDP